METGILHAHSGLRYLVIIFLLGALIRSIAGLAKQNNWGRWDELFSKLLIIFTHLQLILGLAFYFFVREYHTQFSNMSSVMGDGDLRFKVVEHGLTMLVAIVLITIGRSKSKRAESHLKKHKLATIFYGIAFLLIILGTPADAWGIG